MKYKVISIFIASMVLIGSFWFQNIRIKPNRYKQHLNERVEATININSDETLNTYLPVIVIDHKESGKLEVQMQYFEGEEYGEYSAQINVVGDEVDSTTKKSYEISNIEDTINKEDCGIWVLDGMQEDSTFMRNYIGYTLAGQMSLKTPEAWFCELIIDGKYKGLYLVTQKINDGEEIPSFLDETTSFTEATPYMFELTIKDEVTDRRLNTFRDYAGRKGMVEGAEQTVELIYPDSTLTKEQINFIEKDISQFEKALLSFDSADLQYGYPSFLDIASFVDYYVINEWMMNTKAMRDNTFMYKNVNENLQVLTSDFNQSFRKNEQGKSVVGEMIMSDIYWYYYLVKDERFISEVIKRYEGLRKDILNTNEVTVLIDGTQDYLQHAIQREYTMRYSEDNKINYNEEVEQLKDIIIQRSKYLDKNIQRLKSQSHYSINKQFKHIEGK